ncbi:MAG: nucleotidyltransferase domain-containing protein [Candidatus Eisenbacteria bacterium]|nr:nucleotidyltransferase domain-containing protein [Candidatus Eisenbacteria bacterium]
MSKPQLRETIRSTLVELVGPGLVSAYLFGSVAERREHRESDVDLAVLVRREMYATARSRFDLRVRLMARLTSNLAGRPVDLVILNEAAPLLGRRIVLDGERIVCLDPAIDSDYVCAIQLRAADIGPFLVRMDRLKRDYLRNR